MLGLQTTGPGYGHTGQPSRCRQSRRYPIDWVFCLTTLPKRVSCAVRQLAAGQGRSHRQTKGVAMIDPSDVELAAMKKCPKAFGEAAGEIGFTKPLGDYSGSRGAGGRSTPSSLLLHRGNGRAPRASKYPPGARYDACARPLANPFADLEDDLPWEEPKGRSHDGLQLLIEHLGSGHHPGGCWSCSRPCARQSERQYLGPRVSAWPASERCSSSTPRHPSTTGVTSPGRMLRIFERGHVMEDCMVAWLRDAGFDLCTRKADGEQFGFRWPMAACRATSTASSSAAPRASPIPRSGNKCLGNKSWSDWTRRPTFQARLRRASGDLPSLPSRIARAPGDLHGINADTMEIYTELKAL